MKWFRRKKKQEEPINELSVGYKMTLLRYEKAMIRLAATLKDKSKYTEMERARIEYRIQQQFSNKEDRELWEIRDDLFNWILLVELRTELLV